MPISSALPPDEWPEIFARMDALLLTGGSDIDPALYGEQMAGSEEVDAERDRLELAAWRAAEERALPVLGICRGLQAINVFAGGSLIQDVPEHAGTSYGDGAAEIHNLVIDPDSRLARSIAAAAPEGLAATDEGDSSIELLVNTFHHQAIDHSRLAPSLRAVGWASSSHGRLVEAAESRDGRWIVGVQCHPERTDSTPERIRGALRGLRPSGSRGGGRSHRLGRVLPAAGPAPTGRRPPAGRAAYARARTPILTHPPTLSFARRGAADLGSGGLPVSRPARRLWCSFRCPFSISAIGPRPSSARRSASSTATSG